MISLSLWSHEYLYINSWDFQTAWPAVRSGASPCILNCLTILAPPSNTTNDPDLNYFIFIILFFIF